ncbi:unnamed protein product [Brassica napus]|uniref:RNase H type-1 domain-containing protein n=2 Tax=Brassica TaxID=3705 RepID=A0A3P6EU42_BRAOL|nr:unnamed protein product [Brassica napus]VDD38424.1 unnamed protein product [Brassica oleracea]
MIVTSTTFEWCGRFVLVIEYVVRVFVAAVIVLLRLQLQVSNWSGLKQFPVTNCAGVAIVVIGTSCHSLATPIAVFTYKRSVSVLGVTAFGGAGVLDGEVVPIFRDWFSVACVGSSVGAFKIVVFSILVLVWYGVVCIFGLFSATVKCPEDHWFAIFFAPVKSSELKCVVPHYVVWSGGWACFFYFAWFSRISGVGGLSSLEAHPRCIWLSPYKLLVVLSFMANISSFLFLKLLVTWGEFQLVLLLYVSCGWALVSLLMGFSYYAAWNKDKLVAGLGWVFSGPSIEAPINGSMVESSIGSPLIAEAFAAQSALCMVITLEFRSLEVFSDNLTLIRAISGEFQAKEIIGIVKDIRSISSEFANVSFSHFPRSENSIADGLAKGALQASLML